MNELELSKFGVQELDSKEMENLEGGDLGITLGLIGTAWFAIEAYNNRKAIAEGFLSMF